VCVHSVAAMATASLSAASAGVHVGATERRKNTRFAMRFSVFLRALGDPWTLSETSDISAAGAMFITDRPFLLNTPIEYVLTFPPELTKAARPIRVRFHGTVLRCERLLSGDGVFGVAVRNTAHRYLAGEEAATFDALDQKWNVAASRSDRSHSRPIQS